MSYPHILQHGAIAGVTGSCHQLRMDTQQSLFGGCGLFQAADASQVGAVGLDNLAIYAPLSDTKALLFPHVHIDRLGRNSYLHAADFNWPILCSESSTKLLLDDALKCGFSCDKQQTVRYLERLEPQIQLCRTTGGFPLSMLSNSRLQSVGSAQCISLVRLM